MAYAADSFAPFDGTPASEDQWRQFMRRGNISGVVRNQGSELQVFGDSTGKQVKLKLGEVWIESHWGQNATVDKPLTITDNTSGSARLDLVVARCDFNANTIEWDVLAGTPSGTPVVPAVTRNSAKYELPLAVVSVSNGFSTITAGDVSDARQWGGPPVATVTDDFNQWGDRISSCPRNNISSTSSLTNGQLYVARMASIGEQTCTKIRMCPSTLPSGGTTAVRIFRGFQQNRLTTFVDATTAAFLYGGSVDTVHESAIPTTTFRAGEVIVVAVLGLSTTTAASLITNAVTWSGGNSNTFLNVQSSNVTTAFKAAASMPSSLNLLDGTWNLRDRIFWSALA